MWSLYLFPGGGGLGAINQVRAGGGGGGCTGQPWLAGWALPPPHPKGGPSLVKVCRMFTHNSLLFWMIYTANLYNQLVHKFCNTLKILIYYHPYKYTKILIHLEWTLHQTTGHATRQLACIKAMFSKTVAIFYYLPGAKNHHPVQLGKRLCAGTVGGNNNMYHFLLVDSRSKTKRWTIWEQSGNWVKLNVFVTTHRWTSIGLKNY